jgi:hypothetical protein
MKTASMKLDSSTVPGIGREKSPRDTTSALVNSIMGIKQQHAQVAESPGYFLQHSCFLGSKFDMEAP